MRVDIRLPLKRETKQLSALTNTVNFPLSSSERRGSSWGWSLTIPSLRRVSWGRQMTAGEVRLPANKLQPAPNCEVNPSKEGRRSCPPCQEEDPLSIQINTKALSFHFLLFLRPRDKPYIGNITKRLLQCDLSFVCQKCTCHANVAWKNKTKNRSSKQHF